MKIVETYFSKEEIKELENSYFKVKSKDVAAYEIESINTGHSWVIHKCLWEYDNKPVEIYHKHKKSKKYHRHWKCKTVHQAIRSIKSHDRYYLENKRMYKFIIGK